VTLRTEAVKLATHVDNDARLVFANDDRLIAIFSKLDGLHGEWTGRWYLEAGFGPLDGPHRPHFGSLEEALGWIEARMNG
jgi:hypothetical protein